MADDKENAAQLVRQVETLRARLKGHERVEALRKRAEGELRSSRDAFRQVVEKSCDGIVIIDHSGIARFANSAALTLLGRRASEVVGRPYAPLPPSVTDAEIGVFRQDGSTGLGEVRLSPTTWDGQDARLVTVRDVTEQKQAERRLRHDSLHDPLTRLPNRGLFLERLTHAHRQSKRRRDFAFAVILVGVDRFKVINDSLGPVVGDRLLVELGRRIISCMRDLDLVARVGGDEFGVLLEETRDVSDPSRVAERILTALERPFTLEGHEVIATVSMGIAVSRTGYERVEEVLRDAEAALHHAKDNGKGRYEIFDREMYERAVTRLRMETDLRKALERREFLLFYQPIISISTGIITGFEALVRWRHPTRGLMQPIQFLPLVEEMEMMAPLTHWILREACTETLRWQELSEADPPLSVSVNLSPGMFAQPDLVQQVRSILDETGLPGPRLKLEITEGALLGHDEEVTVNLFDLRLMGVHLHMDDFGTGYSSLSYLHRYPLDTLKIDRSFVTQVARPGDSAEIIRSIVLLADSLDMDVIAEGVETPLQLERIRALRCGYAQGFYFSKPIDTGSIGPLIGGNPVWGEGE